MSRNIIAGNGNTIPPELDAGFRFLVMLSNGHALFIAENISTRKIEISGIAFAYGVVGYFKGEQFSFEESQNGYIYVDLTTHLDPAIADEARIYFSSTELSPQEDSIDHTAGTYRILVCTTNSSGQVDTVYNRKNFPNYAYNAETAQRVTGSIASEATATTQPTSNNSTKVATTKFVHDAIAAEQYQSTLSAPNFSTSQNVCYKRLKLVGITFAGEYQSISQGPVTIATVPAGYRPQSRITIRCQAGNDMADGYIDTNGSVVLNHGLGSAMGSSVAFNCSYIVS